MLHHCLALAFIIVLFGLAATSQVQLMHARADAKEYRLMWERERRACSARQLDDRLSELEERTREISKKPGTKVDEVKANLDGARRRFAVLVRAEARACPKPVACPAPAAGADAAPCEAMTVVGPSRNSIENADRLERLQKWLREHMRAYHEVTL